MQIFGRRILILGCPGSGKSTFACQLSSILDIPVFRLDDMYWQDGWQRPDELEFFDNLRQIIIKKCWILDGNYAHFLFQERVVNADTVIYLDVSTGMSLWGIFWRALRQKLGDVESLPQNISTNYRFHLPLKFVKYVILFRKRVRPKMMNAIRDCNKQVFVLRSRKSTMKFLEGLKINKKVFDCVSTDP